MFGGRGSAKSHTIASIFVSTAAKKRIRTLCCRETQTSIRDSVKRLLDDKIAAMGLQGFFISTDTEIRCPENGSLFVFSGLHSSINAVKSMEGFHRVWVEEAQTVSKSSLEILTPTIRKDGDLGEHAELWFSWNPRKKADPVDDFFRGNGPRKPGEHWSPHPDAICGQINYWDNPWFPESLRVDMEVDRERDQDKYEHVWLGGYERNSETRIFKNWRIGSRDEFRTDEKTRFYFGGDWGFAIDPSVLVRCYLDGRTLYIDAESHAVGCDIDYLPFLFAGTNDEELQRLNKEAWLSSGLSKWRHLTGIRDARRWPITADSSRPETISYMQRHGFPRIVPAKKGPNSIKDGIEFLKKYDIVVHPDCLHAIDELTLYSWKIDKITNEILPVPEDKKNHVIDALRYAVEGIRLAGIPLSQSTLVGTPRPRVVQVMVNPGRKQF